MAKIFYYSAANSFSVMISTMVLLMASIEKTAAQIGVCYGMSGSNLPSPKDVVALYNQHNLQRMRVYGPNDAIFQALRGTNIEVMLGVPNEDIEQLASKQSEADTWIQNNVKNYKDVKFKYIVVGNEVSPSDRTAHFLIPAMEMIQNSINSAGLGNRIKVSSAVSTNVLGRFYPPSKGSFISDYEPITNPLIEFLMENSSPLLVNLHPYFSYTGNLKYVSLEYALFESSSIVVKDGVYGYQNLFDSILDAMYLALEKVGGESLDIVVSETGWPSSGGIGTSSVNAKTYYKNVIQHVSKGGTPRRPKPIETYLFAMFNENQKSPEYEKHWGLFFPNKHCKYGYIKFDDY